MSFTVGADAYDRFMGRYSRQLAPSLADLAGVVSGQRVLDVGCGPGALTGELVRRLGSEEAVAAVDPSESFVAAVQERYPGVEVRRAYAEELPYDDGVFDAALAQLVVHFMTDPVAGLGEMRRVTRADGVVAACVWDYAGGRGPPSPFWEAARRLDPDAPSESGRAGARAGHLAELMEAAGLREVQQTTVSAAVEHLTFEDWWEPFTLGVAPAGSYAASLDPDRLAQVEDHARTLLPPAPFTLEAVAWAACGMV